MDPMFASWTLLSGYASYNDNIILSSHIFNYEFMDCFQTCEIGARHYSAVTWVSRLRSLCSWVFVQTFVRLTSKKHQRSALLALCEGNLQVISQFWSPVDSLSEGQWCRSLSQFSSQMASVAESLSISRCHHAYGSYTLAIYQAGV